MALTPKIPPQFQVHNKNLDIFIYSHIPFRPCVTNPVYKILTCSHEDFPVTKLQLYRDYNYEGTLSYDNLVWNEYSGIHALANDSKIKLKKYVGMNHYRRYFYWMDKVPEMDVMFENFDIVLGTPVYFHDALKCGEHEFDVMSQYGYYHNVRDLMKCEEIIRDMYPDMSDTVDTVFHENNYLFNSFMSIWDREDFLNYTDFAFSILNAFCDEYNCHTADEWREYVKKHYDWYYKPFNSYYSDVDIAARVVGYIAERVCNVFLHHKWDDGKSLVDTAAIIPWGMVNEEDYKV